MPIWGHRKAPKSGNGHDSGRSSSPKGHKHDWREIRRTRVTKGPFKGKDMVMFKCQAEGCANPDKMEIQ